MFEIRQPATPAEIAQLVESFDVPSAPAGLVEAEISELATVADLGAVHTVLAIPAPRPGADTVYTVAEVAQSWSTGGGSQRDQESYRRASARAADPAFAPELLFEPTRATSSGWWMLDGIHRAAALYAARTATGVTALRLRVFVLPRQLR